MNASGAQILGICLLAAAATGCAGARAAGPPAPGPGEMSAAEIKAVYRARTDSLRMRFTAADVAFMTGMIPHHAQAIVMSEWAPSHSENASLRTLAARIINAQTDEIALMQEWLRARGQPVPEVHVMDGQLMVHGAEHEMPMPGVLSPDQMKQLEQARGTEFDRLFLTFMIQHHRGAVTMVDKLFASQGAAQDEAAFKFASDVQADQTTEVARMERMLAGLPGGDR